MESRTDEFELTSIEPERSEDADAVTANDPLVELDDIVAEVARRDRELEEEGDQQREALQDFLTAFETACRTEVLPAMQTVLERLQSHGGGGVIEEHPGGEARFRNPCVFFWMSFQGDIVGEPRPDREPYLQIEADVTRRDIQVSEGDMWRGAGGKRSGRIDRWGISDLSRDRITNELLAVARRAAS